MASNASRKLPGSPCRKVQCCESDRVSLASQNDRKASHKAVPLPTRSPFSSPTSDCCRVKSPIPNYPKSRELRGNIIFKFIFVFAMLCNMSGGETVRKFNCMFYVFRRWTFFSGSTAFDCYHSDLASGTVSRVSPRQSGCIDRWK